MALNIPNAPQRNYSLAIHSYLLRLWMVKFRAWFPMGICSSTRVSLHKNNRRLGPYLISLKCIKPLHTVLLGVRWYWVCCSTKEKLWRGRKSNEKQSTNWRKHNSRNTQTFKLLKNLYSPSGKELFMAAQGG